MRARSNAGYGDTLIVIVVKRTHLKVFSRWFNWGFEGLCRFRLSQVDAESPKCNLFCMKKFIEPTDVERVRDYNGKETPYPIGYEFWLSDAEREELGVKP